MSTQWGGRSHSSTRSVKARRSPAESRALLSSSHPLQSKADTWLRMLRLTIGCRASRVAVLQLQCCMLHAWSAAEWVGSHEYSTVAGVHLRAMARTREYFHVPLAACCADRSGERQCSDATVQ